MDTQSTISISFPRPGQWSRFVITAMWTDAEGFRNRRSFRSQDLTEAQQQSLQTVIASIVALGEPWQATHAVACLYVPPAEPTAELLPEGEEDATSPLPDAEALLLTINARRADGAQRQFTHADYPDLQLTDATMIAAFKNFFQHEA